MSEDTKPLRSLFTDLERLHHLEQRQQDPTTALVVAREASELEPPKGQILFEILKTERIGVSELAESFETDVETMQDHLDELELQGYIDFVSTGQERVYSISSFLAEDEFPAGPIIPLVYQYNLLSDDNRLSALESAIDASVDEGDTVADLGAGVGVLSLLANEAAERVYAVEIDRDVFQRGVEIVDQADGDAIEYLQADARSVELPERVDVVMCEMLDTGLIAELQVPVMNHAVEQLLAEGGRTIPFSATTTMQLRRAEYTFSGIEFRLPHFEAYGSRPSEAMSAEVTYHAVRFDETNPLQVDETVELTADRDGVVNAVQLNTYVTFAEELAETAGSQWLNPPLTLPLAEDHQVAAGETIAVDISYRLGGGLDQITTEVR